MVHKIRANSMSILFIVHRLIEKNSRKTCKIKNQQKNLDMHPFPTTFFNEFLN